MQSGDKNINLFLSLKPARPFIQTHQPCTSCWRCIDTDNNLWEQSKVPVDIAAGGGGVELSWRDNLTSLIAWQLVQVIWKQSMSGWVMTNKLNEQVPHCTCIVLALFAGNVCGNCATIVSHKPSLAMNCCNEIALDPSHSSSIIICKESPWTMF